MFLNIELRLSSLYPQHSSSVAAVNNRRVRQLSFEQLENNIRDNRSQQEKTSDEIRQYFDDFDKAFAYRVDEDLKERSEKVDEVCSRDRDELNWSQDDLLQQYQHKDLWDVIHQIVFCPIAKVASTSWFMNFLKMSGIDQDNIDLVMEGIEGICCINIYKLID